MQDTPPPTVALRSKGNPVQRGAPMWSIADVMLARSLFATWAARTGRTLRAVPVTELTAEELLEFWADDQMDGQRRHSARRDWLHAPAATPVSGKQRSVCQ